MSEHLTVEVNGNCRSCARLLDEVGHRMQEVAKLKTELDKLLALCQRHHICQECGGKQEYGYNHDWREMGFMCRECNKWDEVHHATGRGEGTE